MDRIAEVMRDTGLDFPSVVQLLALEMGYTRTPEPAPMALPPDEAERRAWIEGWMTGATVEWSDRADLVRLTLGMQTREAREVLVAAFKVLGCGDLVRGDGPARFESDASADYDRWRANTTPPTRKPPAS